MQNTNRLTSMRINCGNRSFARSRGSSPKQHHHRNNGIFITSILSCKASVTFVVCCLYLMSCCWLQPIVASSSQKVSGIKLCILHYYVEGKNENQIIYIYICRKSTYTEIYYYFVLIDFLIQGKTEVTSPHTATPLHDL
jgi:hypothetical protein